MGCIDFSGIHRFEKRSETAIKSNSYSILSSDTSSRFVHGCLRHWWWSRNNVDWETNVAPLLVAVDRHSASVIDEKIYITGGRTNENGRDISTNKVQMYSVETNSWTYRAQMIQGREMHSSVAFKGKLYVAGGFTWKNVSYLGR
ncbi:kelch-like protein 36 [Arctopsyche grandis]|uniref:kelch-like protein 36 n=1 Tax=Arctopsyche grandis TaxID=121162 RepID=UPI00406D6440